MKNKVSVVVPVYFNEESLDKLFYELENLDNELQKKIFAWN